MAEPQPTPLPEPQMPVPLKFSYFSSSRTVQLLTTLLHKEPFRKDPLLRERVVTDLGRTMNCQALPTILESLNDEDWRVRVAAVACLGQMPLYWVAADLTAAVSAKDNRVAAEA
ncbi:MAG: HEAT repeat domain-containing protein, partial [Planctomycetes bacterium]|nr:HEAT repeat domain-containing protein [Planctomycetota bacterium]